jgi:hypothetical protein
VAELPLGDAMATLRDVTAEAMAAPQKITVDQLANVAAWALIALAKARKASVGKCECEDCRE